MAFVEICHRHSSHNRCSGNLLAPQPGQGLALSTGLERMELGFNPSENLRDFHPVAPKVLHISPH